MEFKITKVISATAQIQPDDIRNIAKGVLSLLLMRDDTCFDGYSFWVDKKKRLRARHISDVVKKKLTDRDKLIFKLFKEIDGLELKRFDRIGVVHDHPET